MRKLFLTMVMVISLFSSEYKVSKEDSTIKFEASKMLFVGVSGEFTEFSGSVKLDENNKLSKIDGVVSIDSINTNDEERDAHLKADDYFHMIKFPNIVFRSITIVDDIVKAKVSMKGIEKELDFKISEITVSSDNVSFKLESTVDRQEFMLNGSMSAVISDDVDVIANIVAVRVK